MYYCTTLPEAQDHARQGHCVAVQLGVLRYPDDLKPPPEPEDELLVMGMMIYDDDHSLQAPASEPQRKRPWWKFW